MTKFLGLDSENRVARFLMTDPKNSYKKSHQVSAFVEDDAHVEILASLPSGSVVEMTPRKSDQGSPCGVTVAQLTKI